MERLKVLMLIPLLGVMVFWMTACEMPWESDDDDDPIGNSTIQGNVDDFAASASAKAGNMEGITVHLEGPVDKSTTTDENGFFIFSGLPVGTYTIRFTYNGEEVRYRGNSGQEAEIVVAENQRVELTGITVSGGTVNIGNIRYVDLTPVSDDTSVTTTTTTTTTVPPEAPIATGTVTMTVNVRRK